MASRAEAGRKSKDKLSRGSKAKVWSVRSVLFNHTIRHELMPLGSNPITMVLQSTKRMQTPDILEAGELRQLFGELSLRERVMVLLDSVTGLPADILNPAQGQRRRHQGGAGTSPARHD